MTGPDPRVVEEKVLCKGRRFLFKQYVIEASGRRSVKDVLEHPGAVVILPLLDNDTIVLLKQYRPGPRDWIYELPAGTIEKGEDPEETARRELLEETGYYAKTLELVFKMYPSPGVSTEVMYMYVARDLVEREASPEEGEFIETTTVRLDEALEMIRRGVIVDGKTIALILYYAMFIR